MTTFISKLMKTLVLDSDDQPMGRLYDLVIQAEGSHLDIIGIVVKRGRQKVVVSSDKLAAVNGHLKVRTHQNETPEVWPVAEDDQFRLVRDVLDAQVIDMDGAKVIRVNDIQLDWIGGRLIVSGLDIGPWGICRRLGLAPFLAAVQRRFHVNIREGVVPLDQVAPLSKGQQSLQLRVPTEQLSRMHPADLADIIAELGHDDRQAILSNMSVEQTADLVEESDVNVQLAILQDLGEDRAADVLDAMEPDEAADLLSEVAEEDRDRLMDLMEPEGAEEVRELMQWPEGTAGALMNTNFWSLPHTITVGEAITRLRGGIPLCEEVLHVYVMDDHEHLQGVCNLRRLLAAKDEQPVVDLMEGEPDSLPPTASVTEIRQLIARYKLLAVPVVEEESKKLLGVVTIYDMIDQLFGIDEP